MIDKPLAYRMRPKTLDEVIGQTKIVSFLKNLKENNALISMIFYGTPGTGKTTLAKAFASSMNAYSISLNAVTDNKAKMERAFDEAIRMAPSIVIIDEIHRLDKAKQDLLLPHLENGDFYLIGCTTANPLISINPAIRSRTRLLEMGKLTKQDILTGLKRAISAKEGLDDSRKINDDALEYLAKISGGDFRFAYNQLECICYSYSKNHAITLEDAKSISNVPNYLADKDEDEHYNTVSALQKSIRGSDVNAAIYYLAKLIRSGDLEGITRRLVVTAYEDVGLANPQAVDRCYNACKTALEVGLPEAMIPLGFSVVELSLSPKSKSACLAIEDALSQVDDSPIEVKDYLKLTRANVSEEQSYPYDDPDVWEILQYLPDELVGTEFYHPQSSGKYERALSENYRRLKEMKHTSDMALAKKMAREKRKN
mgnify:CR=1 FL=1